MRFTASQNYSTFVFAIVGAVSLVGCREQPTQQVISPAIQTLLVERSDSAREQSRQHLIQQIMLYKSHVAKIAGGKFPDIPFTIESGNADKTGRSRKYQNTLAFRQYVYHWRDSLRATGPLDLRDTLRSSNAPAGLRSYPFSSSTQ